MNEAKKYSSLRIETAEKGGYIVTDFPMNLGALAVPIIACSTLEEVVSWVRSNMVRKNVSPVDRGGAPMAM